MIKMTARKATPAKDTTVIMAAEATEKLALTASVNLEPKEFATGSKGFRFLGKFATSDGERFQADGNVILVGSKDNPAATVTALQADVAAQLAALVRLEAHTMQFSTGSTGLFSQGKLTAGGQKFQVSAKAVRIRKTA